MKYVRDIPYQTLYKYIRWHLGYYDHPLSGVMDHFGEMHYFTWAYDDNTVSVFELTRLEKFKLHASHFIFDSLVGKHTNYINGERACWYRVRSPKWLHNFGFKLFYHKDFQKLRAALFTVTVPATDRTEKHTEEG
jgi:hypothetical protein